MSKEKPLSRLLRKLADTLDEYDCNEDMLGNLIQTMIEDHKRIERLTTAMVLLMEDQQPRQGKKAKIVSINKA